MKLPARLLTWLGGPRIAAWAAALAIALTLPTLATGLVLDDHVQRVAVDEELRLPGMEGSPVDAFIFVPFDAGMRRTLVENGHAPWWSHPELQLAFWRPVSSLTHWVDYRLWPDWPVIMHAQNLAWLAAMVLAAAALYRRLLAPGVAPWVAGLAVLLFALDDGHGLPAGWIANRNALIAGTFGCLAILAHDRWRQGAWKAGRFVAPAVFAVGLLSGESALAAVGYLFAHALFLERGWRERALALLPYAVVVVAWRIAYRALGYGAYASGLYLDPLLEPGAYAGVAAQRAAILLLGQLGAPPPDTFMTLPPAGRVALVAVAIAFLGVVAWVLAPRLRRDPRARFWAAGMALSVLPSCSTFPADRLLSLTGLGGMALVALVIGDLVSPPAWQPTPRRGASALGWFLLAVNGVLAPLLLVPRSLVPRVVRELSTRALDSAPGDPEIARQTLVVVNASDVFTATYIPVWNRATGRSLPHRVRCLGATRAPVRVTRTGDRTLLLRPEQGYLGEPLDDLIRSAELPLALGEEVVLGGLRAKVTALTPDGRPAEVEATLDVPLEDPSLRWIAWTRKGFAPFTPPAPGSSVTLEATSITDPL